MITVITGAASGMGRRAALRAAAAGTALALLDRDSEGLKAVEAEIAALGTEATVCLCPVDLADAGQIAEVCARIVQCGPLGGLVHAAGVSPSMATWDQVFLINLVGTVRLVEGLEPAVTTGSAAVLVSSIAAHRVIGDPAAPRVEPIVREPDDPRLLERLAEVPVDFPGNTYLAYAWAKRGVNLFTQAKAGAWGRRGARINSLSPGMIDTPMGKRDDRLFPHMAELLTRTPLGRKGTDDEIAGAVEFLLSPAASFVTGTDLLVDGGAVAGGLGSGTPAQSD